MYKIFVEEKEIILTNVQDFFEKNKSFPIDEVSMEEIMNELQKKKVKKIVLFHPKEAKLLPKFLKKLPLVRAGGGIVFNEKKEILFIKRKGKWDLPKGKLEKEEDLRDCALREVMEETGIQDLHLERFHAVSYHIFKRNGIFQLKETHWFQMFSSFSGEFSPQIEEEIEKVKWISEENLEKILQKSYPNIQELFRKSF